MTIENTTNEQKASTEQWVSFATNLLAKEKMYSVEVKKILIERGVEEEQAEIIVNEASTQAAKAKKAGAQKDILWGAIWCLGGIVLTAADIGYIFWGAIVFGGIQLVKGLSNS